MVFDITKYSGNYGMHCPDEASAEIFTEYLHGLGKTWRGGTSYLDMTNFSTYTEETVYDFNEGQYGSRHYFINDGYTVLNFYDFEWCSPDEDVGSPMTFDEMFFGGSEGNQTDV